MVVPMPALSPTMTQGVISEWLKKEGEKIKSGDVVAKIETDKATVDFEATDDSWLAKILKTGGEVKVGEPIMVTCDDEEEIAGLKSFVLPATASAVAPKAAPKAEAPAPAVAKEVPAPVSAPSPSSPPPAPALVDAAASGDYVAWPAWGKSLSKTPLGASLLRNEN